MSAAAWPGCNEGHLHELANGGMNSRHDAMALGRKHRRTLDRIFEEPTRASGLTLH